MSYVTVIWSVIASGSLLLALMYGCVWIMDRKARASLAFAFEALAIVGTVIVELGMMHSSSPEEFGEWVRWTQVPVLVRTAALVAFIHYYFGTARPWLMASVVGSRLIVAVAGFIVDPNFNFSRIDSIARIPFLGEQVTILDQAQPSPYQWFALLTASLVLVFIVDSSLTLWRKGTPEARRKTIVIGGATLLSMTLATAYTQLLIYDVVRLPALMSPPYLIMLTAMTFELSRETLSAARLGRELRASESRLDLAASAAGLALWSWDVSSNRMWVSVRARAMFGMSGDETIELQRVLSMIEADDAEQVMRAWREAVASGAEVEAHFRLRLKDDDVRWVLARGRSEKDAAGNLVSVQGVLRDVTDQQRAREENEELRRDLAHAGRVSVLGTLSSSLAHELAQPLGAILLNAEAGELLLKRPNPDLDEIRQILIDIQRDDRRAAEVIEGLRRFLKRRQLDFAEVPVDTLIQDVATLLKSDAIARNVTLECTSDPGLPAIRGDKVHLSQVLINVLMNGMDAVAGQAPARRQVRLQASSDGNGNIELTVRDSGSGIEPAAQARIFEPFFTTKASGMGMGLSVSRTIVEAHGGRLWAENGEEGGAMFRILLPSAETVGEPA
jgi:two-component system, LuxR family, sensor kinase FixL